MSLRRLFKRLPLILAAAALAFGIAYWKYSGAVAIGFGSLVWIPISADTFWLPRPISLALREPGAPGSAGASRMDNGKRRLPSRAAPCLAEWRESG